MYWTDKASPAEIAANVGSSPKEILKIISGLQLVVDAAIRNDVKSDLYKIAARMYFYERKDISGIASDMGLTYSDVWHFLKRFTDKIDGQSPEVCKLLTYLGGA
jgi:predicted transcriptional regulator